jgi:phage terminase large subunit-like protein
MSYAIKAFNNALYSGEILNDGNKNYKRHLGNAVKKILKIRDENGVPLWTIYKERPDSVHKIDMAMAGILSWEARSDAISSGVIKKSKSVYESRGLTSV